MTDQPSKPFQQTSDLLLQDPQVAAIYLEEILADGDMELFKEALKDVASARLGSMTKLAEEADLAREALYKSLSRQGNPRFETLTKILTAAGLRLSVTPLHP
jgi:probable addiction module antidote protein